MKPKGVATHNARKCKEASQYLINWGSALLISMLVLVISCAKSDDLETIVNQSLIENVPATDNESLIIYTDVSPDFSSQKMNDFYNLDLNNDGIVDFRLLSFDTSGTAIFGEYK